MHRFTLRSFSIGIAATCAVLLTDVARAQQPAPNQRANPQLEQRRFATVDPLPAQGARGISVDQPFSLSFSEPVDATTLTPSTVFAAIAGLPLPATQTLSLNRRVLRIDFQAPLPHLAEVVVSVDGHRIRTSGGLPIDADADGASGGVGRFTFSTAAPLGQGPGRILGFVFGSGGKPLPGAEISAVYYPTRDGEPPLPVPSAFSDATGYFDYATVPITGVTSFLVRIRMAGFSEILRRVDLMAGGCWRVEDAYLQPVSPPVLVKAAIGATLMDPTGTVELVIPPGALMQDSSIGLTILDSAQLIRDELPELVMDAGTFVDVAGVFGDATNTPVTMRIPNALGLPLIDPNTGQPTRVPMGKIDHNTLEWVDLRDAYGGSGPPPDGLLGTVVSDGSAGTRIEFQLDHFCTVCTGLCLSVPQGLLDAIENAAAGNPDCTPAGDPGQEAGNSVVATRDGGLWEYLELPGFTERGRTVPIRMGYLSVAAAPSVTFQGFVDYASTRPVERTIFEYRIEGVVKSGAYAATQNNIRPRSSYLWDGKNGLGELLSTGSYPIELQTKSLNAMQNVAVPAFFGGPPASVFAGITYPGLSEVRQPPAASRAILVNLRESPYGAGWSFMPETRLYFDADGCIVLVQGNADYRLFVPDASTPYRWVSPDGEASTLTAEPTTRSYVRSWSSGRRQVFDLAGRIQSDTDRYGHAHSFGYSAGLLSTYTTPTGFRVDLGYDGNGKLTQISDSAGRVSLFGVDANGDLTLHTDAIGRASTYEYDAEHRLTRRTGPRGDSSVYAYESGRVHEVQLFDTTARGNALVRTRTFDPSLVATDLQTAIDAGLGSLALPIPVVAEWRSTYTDGTGATTAVVTDANGKVVVATDGLGRDTSYAYDTNGQVARRTDSDGTRVEFDYDAEGRMITERRYDPGGVVRSTWNNQFQGPYGQASRVVDTGGREILLSHDQNGNVTQVVRDGQAVMTIAYESATFPDLPTRVVQAVGSVIESTYDSHGNLASLTYVPDPIGQPGGNTESYTADAAGNPIQLVDGTLRTFGFGYDAFNRLTSVTDPDSRTTTLTYGNSELPESLTFDDASQIAFEYDAAYRKVRRTDQTGRHDSYSYDAEGRLTQYVNRNGELVRYELNAIGQMVQKLMPDGAVSVYEYDPLGRITHAATSTSSVDITLDALGRATAVRSIIRSMDGDPATLPIDRTLSYSFDPSGRVLRVDDGDIYDASYTYDARGELATVVQNSLGRSWSLAHDDLGRRQSVTLPASGVTSVYGYDAGARLTSITHSTTPAIGNGYTAYDGALAILGGTLSLPARVVSQAYGYDPTGRLQTANYGTAFGDAQPDLTYAIGPANRLTGDGESNYSYDFAGRLTRRVSANGTIVDDYRYDAEGRLTRVEQTADVSGVPTIVSTVDYGYDALGRRIERRVNGVSTRFVYDRRNLALEFDARGQVELAYVHGVDIDAPFAVHESAIDRTLYYHADHLGSVVALSDDTGAIVQQYVYDEFGNCLFEADPSIAQSFGFAGRERDLETGLYYLRNRYYDPVVGRFMSEDPSDVGGGLNLYAYVANDPVNEVDPFGLFPIKPDCLRETYEKCVADSKKETIWLKRMLNVIGFFRGDWSVKIGTKKANRVAESVGSALETFGLGIAFRNEADPWYDLGVNSTESLALESLEAFLISGPAGSCMVHALATCGL